MFNILVSALNCEKYLETHNPAKVRSFFKSLNKKNSKKLLKGLIDV